MTGCEAMGTSCNTGNWDEMHEIPFSLVVRCSKRAPTETV